jgi:hypothetical protein
LPLAQGRLGAGVHSRCRPSGSTGPR